jgi:hypothetical protein
MDGRVGILAVLALAPLGAPPPGTEVEVGAERGSYHFVGACGGPHDYVNYAATQGSIRHRTEAGWTAAVQGVARVGSVVRSTPEPDSADLSEVHVGRRQDAFALAARVGFHGRYGGFELGPVTGYLTRADNNPGLFILPSVSGWVGRYGAVHAWASLLADRTLSLNRIAGFGLGHASDSLRLSAGLAASGGQDTSLILDGDFRFGGRYWIGGGVQLGETRNTWGGMLRVGIALESTASPRPSQPEAGVN